MTKKSNQITIIIVTYKSVHVIDHALKNFKNTNYPIIIVDNGSNDNLEEYLNYNYKKSQIDLIKIPKNIGFGRANNIALKKIKTKYAFLLNPDAIINVESIENLAIQSDKDEKIAIAGPFNINKQNPTPIEITKAIQNNKNKSKIIFEDKDHIQTDFICGGHMLLKLSAIEKIGFFDENIFLYYEDEDLCNRTISGDYKIIQVKGSFVYHEEHKSTKTNGVIDKYLLLYNRYSHMGWSRIYLKRKNGQKSLKIFFSLIFKFLISFIYLFTLRIKKFIIKLAKINGGLKNLLCYKQ